MKFPEAKGLIENNFEPNQEVMIVNTMSTMDGKIGKVCGKPSYGMVDFYIVCFNEPPEDNRPDTAIMMIESCLKAV